MSTSGNRGASIHQIVLSQEFLKSENTSQRNTSGNGGEGGRAHLLGSAAASKKGFEHFDLGPLSLLSHSLFVTFPHLEMLQLASLSSKNL